MANEIRFPPPQELPESPRGVILHWTGGSHRASSRDKAHYHFLIEHLEGNPETPEDDQLNYLSGVPLERNMRELSSSDPSYASDPETGYAAHTAGFNSHSIGLALCGMRGARDHRPGRPVDPGPSPITRLQVRGMFTLLRQICAVYRLQPVEGQVFTHFEAEALHGVEQARKWDVGWIPGRRFAQRDVGPWIRRYLRRALDGDPIHYPGTP